MKKQPEVPRFGNSIKDNLATNYVQTDGQCGIFLTSLLLPLVGKRYEIRGRGVR